MSQLISGTDPYVLFEQWFAEAMKAEPNDPNAMALATSDEAGRISLRIVLLKGVDEGGFTFFTNTLSLKGKQLKAHPSAALCFHWKSLRRQVRIEGTVGRVSDAEADEYFATRARGSQIGAWASKQSDVLESREALSASVAAYEAQFAEKPVPRPPHWTGFRVAPTLIEFWQDMPFRLHDRLVFTRSGSGWGSGRVYP